jgi:multiple sugar transport system ATP-binding protein
MNFIPATLNGDDRAPAVTIDVEGGQTATLPLSYALSRHTADGKVILGVRPEHLFRYDPELKARKPALASLTAPVEVVEPTGAETIALLKIGDREVVGRFDPDGAPRLGERLPLGIDMAHACLFDPATQILIPRAAH